VIDLIKEVKKISIFSIDRSNRTREDFGDIPALWKDIEENGLIHPPVVKLHNGTYKLIAGERRLLAHIFGKQEEILVNITDKELDAYDIAILEARENRNRKNFNYAEDAKMTSHLHDLFIKKYGQATGGPGSGHGLRDTAQFLGESAATISQDIKLAKMIEQVPELGKMKTRADALSFMKQVEKQMDTAQVVDALQMKAAKTPLDEKRKQLVNSYIIGDFLEKVKGIPDNHFDLIECDPPYGIDLKEQKALDFINLEMEQYEEVPQDEYRKFIENVCTECYRVLKPNSWMLLWFGPHPHFEVVYQAIIKAGFKSNRIPIIWYKERSPAQTIGYNYNLANAYEMCFYARKDNATIQKAGVSNIFPYQTVASQNKAHRTEKPIEMYEKLLETFSKPGANILIPFLGSGVTLLAAANTMRKGIGYDKVEEFKNDFIIKVHAQEPGSYSNSSAQTSERNVCEVCNLKFATIHSGALDKNICDGCAEAMLKELDNENSNETHSS
jgi:site-specific DNA-methyltransferase (adenine-specific)